MTREHGALTCSRGAAPAPRRWRVLWIECVALTLLAGCEGGGLGVEPGGQGSPGEQPVQVTLTVSTDADFSTVAVDERGTVTRCPRIPGAAARCELRYLGHETLTLQAHPGAGWRFDRWSGCEVSRATTVTIVMPARDTECHAHFYPFDDGFDLSVVPQRVSTIPGVLATTQLAIERGPNFVGVPIRLALVDPPASITLTAPAGTVTADTAALALDVPRTARPGHYLLTVRAEATNRQGQDIARTGLVAIDVEDTGHFHIVLETPTLAISPGTSCTLMAGIYRSIGFPDPIGLSASALPPGVSADFNPNPSALNDAQWTLTADADAPFGETEVSVLGSAGSHQSSAALRLAVTAARDSCASGQFALPPVPAAFSIAPSSASTTLPQGEITAVDFTLDRGGGYQGEVFFSATGVPPGMLAKFDPPTPALGNTKRLVLITSPTASLGTFTVDVAATGGGHIATAHLTVEVTPGFASCSEPAIADTFASAFWTSPPPSAALEVGSRDLANAAKAYLAFDAAAIDPVFDRAELVLSLLSSDWVQVDPSGTRPIIVYGVIDNDDWKLLALPEPALNWDNAPKNNRASSHDFVGEGSTPTAPARSLGSFVVRPSDAPGTLYRIDVTDYLRWAINGNPAYSSFAPRDDDGIVTFMMGNNMQYSMGASDYTRLVSRESGAACERPHLEIYR
jgi:hypothetical protein